jgi:hypothetical protein
MANTELLTVIAAIGGSIIGGLISFLTTSTTQRRQFEREHASREMDRREELYGKFIREAAELFLDSIDKNLDEPERLVRLVSMLACIKLSASREVSDAGEKILTAIVSSYQRPPLERNELFKETRKEFKDPLEDFAKACRNERGEIHKRL